jgi:hypothetical protein
LRASRIDDLRIVLRIRIATRIAKTGFQLCKPSKPQDKLEYSPSTKAVPHRFAALLDLRNPPQRVNANSVFAYIPSLPFSPLPLEPLLYRTIHFVYRIMDSCLPESSSTCSEMDEDLPIFPRSPQIVALPRLRHSQPTPRSAQSARCSSSLLRAGAGASSVTGYATSTTIHLQCYY